MRVTERECVLLHLVLDSVIASLVLQWSAAPVQRPKDMYELMFMDY